MLRNYWCHDLQVFGEKKKRRKIMATWLLWPRTLCIGSHTFMIFCNFPKCQTAFKTWKLGLLIYLFTLFHWFTHFNDHYIGAVYYFTRRMDIETKKSFSCLKIIAFFLVVNLNQVPSTILHPYVNFHHYS